MIALFQEKRNIQNKQITIVIIGLHFYLVEVENSESIYFHFETPFLISFIVLNLTFFKLLTFNIIWVIICFAHFRVSFQCCACILISQQLNLLCKPLSSVINNLYCANNIRKPMTHEHTP